MEIGAIRLKFHHVAHSILTRSRSLNLPFSVCVYFAHIAHKQGEICAELLLVGYIEGGVLAGITDLIWSDCKRVHKVRIIVQACALRVA